MRIHRLRNSGLREPNQGESGQGKMTRRNSLLGRSRPKEKLSREEIAALDKVTAPEPRPQPAPKPEKAKGKGEKVTVGISALTFRWIVNCPSCGHKAGGNEIPQPGQRLARCGNYNMIMKATPAFFIKRKV